MILYRGASILLAVGTCWWLTGNVGAMTALAIWVGASAAMCAMAAVLLHRQAPGRIGVVNYAAGFVLPWGYRIGNGRLTAIAITSAIIWALLGAAVVTLRIPASSAAHVDNTHAVLRALLLMSWIIDGGALLYLLSVMSRSPGLVRSLLKVTAIVAAMLIASVALTLFSHPGSGTMMPLALAISGGPPLVVGSAYGLFLLVMLTVGRNARWN